MKTIGLTGIMGAGKSMVISYLQAKGITVLDCDKINAELMKKGNAAYQPLLDVFGNDMRNHHDEIDHKVLAQLIFQDKSKKQQLEAIMHPLIEKEIAYQLTKHEDESLVVVEVPLLFEIHWENHFDEIWVIYGDEEVLLSRLMKHRMMEESEIQQRWKHQLSQSYKCDQSDVIIDNSGSVEMLHQQLDRLIQREG